MLRTSSSADLLLRLRRPPLTIRTTSCSRLDPSLLSSSVQFAYCVRKTSAFSTGSSSELALQGDFESRLRPSRAAPPRGAWYERLRRCRGALPA